MCPLFAYLDPGAGSLVLQMILAGILGVSYTLKLTWRRIMRLVRRTRDESAEMPALAPVAEEQPAPHPREDEG